MHKIVINTFIILTMFNTTEKPSYWEHAYNKLKLKAKSVSFPLILKLYYKLDGNSELPF